MALLPPNSKMLRPKWYACQKKATWRTFVYHYLPSLPATFCPTIFPTYNYDKEMNRKRPKGEAMLYHTLVLPVNETNGTRWSSLIASPTSAPPVNAAQRAGLTLFLFNTSSIIFWVAMVANGVVGAPFLKKSGLRWVGTLMVALVPYYRITAHKRYCGVPT